MDRLLQLNKQTVFREKLFRLAQYASRLLAHLVAAGKSTRRKELLEKLASLEQHLGTARKLLRLGNSVESLQSALRSFHIKDDVHRVTITLARISSAIYLLIDHWLWAGRVGLAKVDKQRWGALSNRFWLLTILLGLTRDAYDIGSRSQLGGLPAVLTNRPLMVDTLRNACDLFLPLAALNYLRVSPGSQGFLGLISSVLALAVIVRPSLRMVP